MTLISLREYGYAVNDDKQHRIYCMQQCLDQNSTSEFIRHCLYVGQFQEIILDDFLSLDIGLDENTKWKIFGLSRWRSPLENIEHLLNEANKKKSRVNFIYGDLNDYSSLVECINQSKPTYCNHDRNNLDKIWLNNKKNITCQKLEIKKFKNLTIL